MKLGIEQESMAIIHILISSILIFNRPLAHHGNAANLTKQKKFSLLGIDIYSHVMF